MKACAKPCMQQSIKNEAGFTLLEVLLAILILASASFVLLVKLPGNFQELRLERSSAELVADLRGIQQSAVTENCWYQIRFYPATGEYMIFRQGTFVRTVKLQAGVSFGGSMPNVIFQPTGAPVPGASVILQTAHGERKVVIAPVMGRIREEIIK